MLINVEINSLLKVMRDSFVSGASTKLTEGSYYHQSSITYQAGKKPILVFQLTTTETSAFYLFVA